MQTNSEEREAHRDDKRRLAANVLKLLDMIGATTTTVPLTRRVKTTIGTTLDVNPEHTATLPTIDTLLSAIGQVSKCRGCNERIFWVTSRRGKRMPIQHDAVNHFAECPQADWFRKKGGGGV